MFQATKMLTNDNSEATKAALRARIRGELKKMTAAERATASTEACRLLEQQPLWQQAHSLLFYAPMAEEVDLWQLLKDALATGKTVFLPRYQAEEKNYIACQIKDAARDLRAGKFGILEPHDFCPVISSIQLDLILVPGIAFDLEGHRLGRGKGFYDQLLKVLHGPACGVGFDQQIVPRVPVEPHDISLSCILTPTRWQSVTGPRAVLK